MSDADIWIELRRSPTALHVRAAPARDAPSLGLLARDEPFVVYAYVPGPECGGAGWGSVAARGFACLEDTLVTTDPPLNLPRLLAFSAPTPADYANYVKTGVYTEGAVSPLVPYIYGRRGGRWSGRVWTSVESYIAGEPSADRLEKKHTYRFVSVLETDHGRVFVRPNGSVVPATDLFLYPVTDFSGRHVEDGPSDTVAWVVGHSGARLRAAPSALGQIVGMLAYHQPLDVTRVPGDSEWWQVEGGYVHTSLIARWIPAPRPAEVGPDELWLDIDLGQQTLALVRGDTPQYLTLISGGVQGDTTPTGSFRIYDKVATSDMKSLEGADDVYHVEQVPWVMHFKPRYALHGAFWHWGFGHAASHGCVNLSPRDARYLFDQVLPALPPGFASIAVADGAKGTLVRIRE